MIFLFGIKFRNNGTVCNTYISEILILFPFFFGQNLKNFHVEFSEFSKILENFRIFILIREFFMKFPKFRSKYTGKNENDETGEKNKFRKENH